MASVNSTQVGGTHYKGVPVQPWDIVSMYRLNYFEGNVLKYLLRTKDNRVEDLRKAIHYLEKEIDNLTSEQTHLQKPPPPAKENPPVEAYDCPPGTVIKTNGPPHLFTQEELRRAIDAHNRHRRYADTEMEGPDVK